MYILCLDFLTNSWPGQIGGSGNHGWSISGVKRQKLSFPTCRYNPKITKKCLRKTIEIISIVFLTHFLVFLELYLQVGKLDFCLLTPLIDHSWIPSHPLPEFGWVLSYTKTYRNSDLKITFSRLFSGQIRPYFLYVSRVKSPHTMIISNQVQKSV